MIILEVLIMEKKPYLVDVPVRVAIWIRPECQRKQFEIIKEARPSILFIQSDGGRNEKEWKSIRINRKMFDEEIDWNCKIYKIYEETNLGLYSMGKKMVDLIWSTVDRCIFLEDDDIPSVSFFRYCAELLEKYKDDLRICRISGINRFGESTNVKSDYFFSPIGHISGTATWRRVYENRDFYFEYAKDEYVMKILKQNTKKDKVFWKRILGYTHNNYFEGHVAGGEFFNSLEYYSQNQLNIIPKYNLISNVGATADSAHSDTLDQLPKGVRNLYNRKTYEIEFPIKHAKYVIPDMEYYTKVEKLEAHNRPVVRTYRKIVRLLLKVKKGDFVYIVDRIKKKFEKEK